LLLKLLLYSPEQQRHRFALAAGHVEQAKRQNNNAASEVSERYSLTLLIRGEFCRVQKVAGKNRMREKDAAERDMALIQMSDSLSCVQHCYNIDRRRREHIKWQMATPLHSSRSIVILTLSRCLHDYLQIDVTHPNVNAAPDDFAQNYGAKHRLRIWQKNNSLF